MADDFESSPAYNPRMSSSQSRDLAPTESPAPAAFPSAATAEQAAGISNPVTAPASASTRLPGIDVARGLAVLLMLQTHAFDGWVSPSAKAGLGYAFSRALANIPAPLFLLLAGVGLSLGAQAAATRGQSDAQIRRQFMWRGLSLLGWGYLVSAIYVAIEWPVPRADLPSLILRADILHCIGLSLLLCAVLVLRRRQLLWRVLVLVGLSLFLSVYIGRHRMVGLPGGLSPLAALFCDVPPYTRFPLLPLIGFCAVGVLLGERLLARAPSPRRLLAWLGGAVVAALLCGLLTQATLQHLGGVLRRSHPAVVWNFGDGCARAVACLAIGGLLASLVRPGAWGLVILRRLGGGSLLAYALHIPFCYGRLARPLAGRLTMATALACLLLLGAAVYGALVLRDALRHRRRRLVG